jgi:hypothetical protein
MAMSLPNGAAYSIATAYATSVNVTAASNASECVMTATNTFAAGDILEVTSGWSKINGRLFRVKAPSGTSFTLEALDTSNLAAFPAGAGIGSVRKITTWQSIIQVQSCDVSGGDPKYVTVAILDTDDEINLSDGFSATSLNLTLLDDPTLPHHTALKVATFSRAATALRAALPNGGILLYNTTVGFNENPTMTKGQAMVVKAGFAVQGRVTRYAS